MVEASWVPKGPDLVVPPEGADHHWRKVLTEGLSIDPVASERMASVS